MYFHFIRRYYTLVICCIFFLCIYFTQLVRALDTSDLPFQVTFDYCLNQNKSTSDVVIKVLFKLEEEYYTYAHSDTGALPTTVVLQDSTGKPIISQTYYPQGEAYDGVLNEDKVIGVYTGDFPVFIQASSDVLKKDLILGVSLLACSSKNCIPVDQQIPIVFPKKIPDLSEVPWEEEYWLYKGFYEQDLSDHALATNDFSTIEKAEEVKLKPQYLQESFEPTRIELALLFGFLAGLILNIMPCVLPVLTLKFSFILSQINQKNEQRYLRLIRIQNIFFVLGIISWFFLLALGVGFLGLTWGAFFQSIPIVFGLIIVIFILALSLFDIFTLPVIDFKINTSSHPYIQSYFTGFMATFLATPCSGPLLGGVLGWAILQPLYIILVVFLATSLGMSLPYIIFALYPNSLFFLPKPGKWCIKVERLVGFFLLGTIIYLISILPGYMFISALVTLLITAIAAWFWGSLGGLTASTVQKFFVGFFALCIIFLSIWWNFQQSVDTDEFYSKECFQTLLGKKPVFLHFTADWCPTCKFLEKTVLTTSFLEKIIEQYGIVPVKVDLTSNNPGGEALLRSLGSISIPVIAIFPSGNEFNQPMILRDLYTQEQLEDALKVTLGQK